MHSNETINQFLNLRAQGWTFARIADHLRVSKPTLLNWSNKHQYELEAMKASRERFSQTATQTSRKEFPLPIRSGEGQREESVQASHEEFPRPIGWGEGQGEGTVRASHALKLEHLILFQTTLRQEIIKRTLQTLSDEELQSMADAIEHQIEKLKGKETR